MKKLPVLSLLLFPLLGFSQAKEFGWLAGTWKTKGKDSYEVWKIAKDKKTMQAVSFGMKGADSVVTERTKIIRDKGSFYFLADVAGDQPEVSFKITAYTEKTFTAENPKHDFPKILRYQLKPDGSLYAEIEGDGKLIPYYFDKRK